MSACVGIPIAPAEVFDAAEKSLAAGDLAGFDRHLDRLLRIAPSWLEALLLGAASFELRDLPRAEKLYRSALKTKPSSAEAAGGLARCLLAGGQDVDLGLLSRLDQIISPEDIAATLRQLCATQKWDAAGTIAQAGGTLAGRITGRNIAGIRYVVFRPAGQLEATSLQQLLAASRASPADIRVAIKLTDNTGDSFGSFRVEAPPPGRYVALLETADARIVGMLLPGVLTVKAAAPLGEVWWSHAGVVCGWLQGAADTCPEITAACDPPCAPISLSYAPLAYAGSDIGPGRRLYGFALLLPMEPARKSIHLSFGPGGPALQGAPIQVAPPFGTALYPALRSCAIAAPDWHLLPRVQREYPRGAAPDAPVDVIIPIYRGFAETKRCIESVRAARNRRPAHLILINDTSPSPEIARYLGGFKDDPEISLIENPENLGFVATVNIGMRLHPSRDVVLLNSDTAVTDGWLDRIVTAANDSPDIATVTPLSNNATILSYPAQHVSNPLPAAEDLAALDRAIAKGRAVPLEIPTAVGFCMFIRRACLDDAGLFDEANFGRGYGEENEFCLRATARGWRHVCAPNVLVGHQGSVSFGNELADVQRQRSQAIEGAFPGYQRYIERFVVADPLLMVRRAADLERLAAASHGPAILMVVPDLSGGTAEHVATLCGALAKEGARCFILTATPSAGRAIEPRARIKVFGQEKQFPNLLFDLPFDLDVLVGGLRRLGIQHVHVHHFLTLPWPLTIIAQRLELPFDVTIHDYGWVCPRVTMVDGSGRYCGAPDAAACENCIKTIGGRLEEDIGVRDLRERSRRLLSAARRVFVPSPDVAARLGRYFPDVAVTVRPHPLGEDPRYENASGQTDPTAVAVLGAINSDKGYDVLLACARDAAARALPLRFAVIGFTQDDSALLRTGRVTITGPYETQELPALIARHGPSVGWVPSVCPETWSLALSHILAAGLWPVAFDLGAPAARIAALGIGNVLPLAAAASEVNDRLVEILGAAPRRRRTRADSVSYPSLRKDYYSLGDWFAPAATTIVAPHGRRPPARVPDRGARRPSMPIEGIGGRNTR